MKLKRILTSIILFAFLLPLAGCGNKTTTHKLAIYTAQADAALVAITDAVAKLDDAGRLSPAAAKQVYVINLRVVSAIDAIRSRAKAGFDKRTTLLIIADAIKDIRAAEASVIGLTGDAKRRFDEITFFAIFTLESIQAVIEAVKEPVIPESRMAEVRRVLSAREDGSVWTDLVLILQTAILRGISQSRMTQDVAFADGEQLSRDLRASLEAKIAVIP